MNSEQTTLDRIRTRPRFKIYTTVSQEDYEQNLKTFLQENSDRFTGNINRESATISVISKDNPFWKPTLSLRSETSENSTILIRGIFGPTAAVWTFFMFLYFVFGTLWMVAITLWFVGRQINSDDYTWGLTASFIILGLILSTYLAAQFGQKMARKEMNQLRDFAKEFISCLEKKET